MKERPMLMSAPMVRAILAGTKTQTRRVMKPQPTGFLGGPGVTMEDGTPAPRVPVDDYAGEFGRVIQCPYGQPGDRLWVREAFSGPYCMEAAEGRAAVPPSKWGRSSSIWFWADGDPQDGDWTKPRPSIHMPRWASRILLEIVGVRVERLQSISGDDCFSEGIDTEGDAYSEGEHFQIGGSPVSAERYAYASLWRSINGDASWESNPWVWVVEFKRTQP